MAIIHYVQNVCHNTTAVWYDADCDMSDASKHFHFQCPLPEGEVQCLPSCCGDRYGTGPCRYRVREVCMVTASWTCPHTDHHGNPQTLTHVWPWYTPAASLYLHTCSTQYYTCYNGQASSTGAVGCRDTGTHDVVPCMLGGWPTVGTADITDNVPCSFLHRLYQSRMLLYL